MDGTNLVFQVDEECRTYGRCLAFACLNHAVEFRYFHGDVFDEREFYFHIFHSFVINLILDGTELGNVAVESVYRKTYQLAVECFKVGCHGGKGHEFRGTH